MTRLALITGAGSGLGKELAFQLAQKKVPLFLTSKDPLKLEKLQQELQSLTSIQIFAADLSIETDLKALLEKIRLETPDLIINNAGLGLYGEILKFPLEKQINLLKVNIQALVEISIESARALKDKRQEGIIVNISSAASFFTYPSFALYAASKGFVKDFSLSFDEELRPFRIRVLTSILGRFDSEFRYNASNHKDRSKPSWDTMSLQKAAGHVLLQIARKKGYQVIDLRYRILHFLSYFFPRRMIAQRLQKTIRGF